MREGRGHFADVAVRYAEQVARPKVPEQGIPACWQIRASCERFLQDIEGDAWTYHAAKVERVCLFAQLFPYLDGQLAAKRLSFRLEPWQTWILAGLFGLVDQHGHRKHREALIMVPRKNGKSTFVAPIALYGLVADYEARAQVYIGAAALKQADFVFQPCRDMANRATGFLQAYGARVTSKKIALSDGSFLEPMIGDPPDGSNPHIAILDEAHENDNYARQRETMRTGMGARTQPLLITITTAGFNEAGPCRQLQAQVEQVLAGELKNDRLFSAIYTIDKGDDWKDFNVWLKANPNVGVSFTEERLRELYQTALNVPSEKPGLLTKHLNVWQSSSDAWVDMRKWDENNDAPAFHDVTNKGYRAWLSCDLSKLMDTTAIGCLVEVPGDDGPTLCFYPQLFLPELAVEKTGKNATAYREWAAMGDLKLTSDAETDFEAVEQRLVELCGLFKVQGIAVDQWQAASMAQRLRGMVEVEVLTYPQNHQNLHPPMSRFEKLLALNQLKQDGNRMMRWQTGNVVANRNSYSFMKPDKPPRRPEAKIDGFVALIMALGLASAAQAAPMEVWMDVLG